MGVHDLREFLVNACVNQVNKLLNSTADGDGNERIMEIRGKARVWHSGLFDFAAMPNFRSGRL